MLKLLQVSKIQVISFSPSGVKAYTEKEKQFLSHI